MANNIIRREKKSLPPPHTHRWLTSSSGGAGGYSGGTWEDKWNECRQLVQSEWENNNKSISDTRWNEWELELLFESLFQDIIMVLFGLQRQVKIITVVIM